MSDLQTDLAAAGVNLSTAAAGLAFDWLLRAHRAADLNRAAEPWPSDWSTTEVLAVSLIMNDGGRLDEMNWTRRQAFDRLRHELGDTYQTPISMEDAATVCAHLAIIRLGLQPYSANDAGRTAAS